MLTQMGKLRLRDAINVANNHTASKGGARI